MTQIQHWAVFIDNQSNKQGLIQRLLTEDKLPPALETLKGLKGALFSKLALDNFIEEEVRHDQKLLTPTSNSGNTENEGIFTPDPATRVIPNTTTKVGNELHKVVVEEVLPTARYVYLRVKEGEEEFWIATRKAEIKKGEVYFYRGGLLKTNFESKEYNRIFDEIYLISNLVSEDHSNHITASANSTGDAKKEIVVKEDIPTHTEKTVVHKGTIKISELVSVPKKYEGHTVQLSGKCVKVNPNIMDRNWIHLQDGSKDDFDMVITSNTFVPEGELITIRAVVSLNRDFGAGYKYDLILENGTLVQ